MPSTHAAGLVAFLRRRYGPPTPDSDLVRAFVGRRDGDAFGQIVARHGPMVLRLCRRVGDAHAAEDAFQATFLVLARRAGAIRRPEALAAWLHGVAVRVCGKARSAAARRRAAEARAVPRTPADPVSELSARELFDALDVELDRLPGRYRLPLVLVYWQGLTYAEAAQRLGLTPGALHGRLDRGRARLAQRLTRRGFAPGDLCALVAVPLTIAVSRDLLAATAALAVDPWSKAVPATVLALVAATTSSKLIPAVALGMTLVGAGLIALAGGAAWRAGSVNDRSDLPPVAHAPGSPADPQPAAPRVDRYGDPLPEGAISRIGTSRLVRYGYVTALSPDGRLIAVSGENYPLRVWDAATGKLLFERRLTSDPMYHTPVTELAFSADSRRLAASSIWHESILLWDIATGQLLQTIPNSAPGQKQWGRQQQGPTLVFSPDGQSLLAAGKDGSLVIWDIAAAREIARLRASDQLALALTVTGDARIALTAHNGGELHLWDVANRRHLRRLDVRPLWPHTAVLAPDGQSFAYYKDYDEVEVRDTGSEAVRGRLKADALVMGLGYAADGGTLWVARDGGEVTAWNVRTGDLRRILICEGLRTTAAVPWQLANWKRQPPRTRAWFHPITRAVVWSESEATRVWDMKTGQESPRLAGHRRGAFWVDFSADGQSLRTGGYSNEVGVWDAATGLERQPFRRVAPPPTTELQSWYSLSADRRRLVVVTGNWDFDAPPVPGEGRIFLWEPFGDHPPTALAEQTGLAMQAVLTPDNRFVVATEAGEKIRVYDSATGRLARTFAGRRLEYYPTFTPDGTILATSSTSGSKAVRLYDFASGQPLRDLSLPGQSADGPASMVEKLTISPDGRFAAYGWSRPPSTSIVVWPFADGREPWQIPTDSGVRSCAFSPDGRLIVSGSPDVRVYEVVSGNDRRRYPGHETGVYAVAFAPDGQRLASGGGDCTALIWQVFDPGAADLTEAVLAAQWADLADNGALAHRAVGALISAKGSVPFLAQRLAPATAGSSERLAQLIADLDNPRFAGREEAEKELTRLTDSAAPELRQALAGNASAEARQRIEKLLKALETPVTNAELLRYLRAVEVLEHIGTAEARQILQRLAGGAPEARLTRDAKASLERLRRAK